MLYCLNGVNAAFCFGDGNLLVASGFRGRVGGCAFLLLDVSGAVCCVGPISLLGEDSLDLHPDALGDVDFDIVHCDDESCLIRVVQSLSLHMLLATTDFESQAYRNKSLVFLAVISLRPASRLALETTGRKATLASCHEKTSLRPLATSRSNWIAHFSDSSLPVVT